MSPPRTEPERNKYRVYALKDKKLAEERDVLAYNCVEAFLVGSSIFKAGRVKFDSINAELTGGVNE